VVVEEYETSCRRFEKRSECDTKGSYIEFAILFDLIHVRCYNKLVRSTTIYCYGVMSHIVPPENWMKMGLDALHPSNYIEMDASESWYVYYREPEEGAWRY
jgi:hypothetical protein